MFCYSSPRMNRTLEGAIRATRRRRVNTRDAPSFARQIPMSVFALPS